MLYSFSEETRHVKEATLFSATIALTEKPRSKSEFFQRLRPLLANFVGEKIDAILAGLKQREDTVSTGIGFGLAVPHAYSPYLSRYFVGVIFIPDGCDWDAADNKPVHIVLLYIGAGTHRSHQTLSVLGAAQKAVSAILSKKSSFDSAVLPEITDVVKSFLVKGELSVDAVSFS